MYPEFAEIDGVRYKINTDFRVALACFRAIEDDEINDVTRAYAVITLLFGVENEENGEIENVPDNITEALRIADDFLSCGVGSKKQVNRKKDMDFEHDRQYIVASFMSDYGIDLETANIHWWKFCELIAGLTEQSILSKVRDLRNTDLNDYKDAKIRNKLQKAMQNVALPTTKQYKPTEEDIDWLKNLGIDTSVIERGL